jgi:molecular chaperone HtpG
MSADFHAPPHEGGTQETEMTAQTETHHFQAEVQEVLGLVIHSLYTNRAIFLRELISNASDALDKLRFEALTDPSLMDKGESLGIAIDADEEAGTLAVADNGIGMSHDELLENLGTIASSGTRRFLEELKERAAKGPAAAPELIGQFGVGFYSAFMVADRVVVETRRAGSDEGWRWSSHGAGEYSIEAAEGLSRGTLITLHMRAQEAEGEEQQKKSEFLSQWRIREIVKSYSDFVEYPIQMEVESLEPKLDDEGKPVEGAEPERVSRTETLNSMKPLWARPKGEIEEAEYKEFYKHLTHDWQDPLDMIHFRAEGTLEYTALMYLPGQRPMDLLEPGQNKSNLSLYVRRVLIMRECEDLLPVWLRFVRGVVEADDLPLNISRETLQDNPRVGQIRRRLEKKVLEVLSGLLESDREKYETFWKAFGLVLKEGVYFGADEDQRISKLCLFESSASTGYTTLREYVERMPEGQEAIYTLAGQDRKTLEDSPHLEALADKGYEVLLLTDPVDEWIRERLTEFDEKPLRALEKGDIDLGGDDAKKEREEKQEAHKDLLEAMKTTLADDVSEVDRKSVV